MFEGDVVLHSTVSNVPQLQKRGMIWLSNESQLTMFDVEVRPAPLSNDHGVKRIMGVVFRTTDERSNHIGGFGDINLLQSLCMLVTVGRF